jgi:hypothetical protein
MLDRILPRSLDNTYRGQKLALWLFGLLVLMKSVIGLNSIFNGAAVMTTADGIALSTYPAAAAQNLVALWALIGLAHVVIGVLGVLVLVRYRGMVPLMFVLLLLQHLGGRLIAQFHPIVRTGAPPASVINLIFLTLMVLGLGLSLRPRRRLN